jgi:hypothetical protein
MISVVSDVYRQDMALFGWQRPAPAGELRTFALSWRDLAIPLLERLGESERANLILTSSLLATEARLQHAQAVLARYSTDWEATKTVLRISPAALKHVVLSRPGLPSFSAGHGVHRGC